MILKDIYTQNSSQRLEKLNSQKNDYEFNSNTMHWKLVRKYTVICTEIYKGGKTLQTWIPQGNGNRQGNEKRQGNKKRQGN